MSKLISINIDVKKINKERLYHGKKGVYCGITMILMDEPDDHGNDVQVWEEQTKDEREAKKDRNFLGSGKVIWTDERDEGSAVEQYESSINNQDPGEDDDLPF